MENALLIFEKIIMNWKAKLIISLVEAAGFCLPLFAGGNYSPTPRELEAFRNLYTGVTQWPVWKISNSRIALDGKLDEVEWQHAQKIYLTGEKMWNDKFYSHPFLWTGLKDFIAVWRFLYDAQYLYISCEFFDNFHSEGDKSSDGALATEPWWINDAVEIALLPSIPAQMGSTPLAINWAQHMVQFTRKFTGEIGLVGNIWGARVPAEPYDTEGNWLTVPEGSDIIAGIETRALPHPDIVRLFAYPGAWCMEIRIPFAGIFPEKGNGFIPPTGSVFKMNPSICDDDNLLRAPDDNTSHRIDMDRFKVDSLAWWGAINASDTALFNSWINPAFFPTFAFAGLRNGTSVWEKMPDELTLYCGATPAKYEEIILTATSVEAGNGAFPAAPALHVSPNPFASSAAITFSVPKRSVVSLKVFDLSGALVGDLGNATYAAGTHTVLWNGKTIHNLQAAPAVYLVRLNTGFQILIKRITIA